MDAKQKEHTARSWLSKLVYWGGALVIGGMCVGGLYGHYAHAAAAPQRLSAPAPTAIEQHAWLPFVETNGGNLVPTVPPVPTLPPTALPSLTPLATVSASPTPLATASASPTPASTPAATPTPTITPNSWWKPTDAQPLQLHWQLSTDFNPATDFVAGATVYDFDGEHATSADVAAVHAKGLIAICYIDVGVFETYRQDAGKFPGATRFTDPNTGKPFVYTGDPQYANQDVIGNADPGWDGSYWLDIRQLAILEPIMQARFAMCKAKGFDAVEPDEQNGYANSSGFSLSYQDQIAYNTWIANAVHALGLSVGLKSDQAQAKDLVNLYDWNLTEECYQYNECDLLAPFHQAHKATWIVEYAKNPNCTDANPQHYNAMRRDLDLVGPNESAYFFQPCLPPGSSSWP